MIENYTMGPNSTKFIYITLRESYKLSDSRVILTCKDMRARSVFKNLRKA